MFSFTFSRDELGRNVRHMLGKTSLVIYSIKVTPK